ncbi:tetratricopeptide repeat protein [Geomesophilobacter sediminis]|uniref:Tetratricopeptide repeat protein n=1 Tax=Geomesophilobacter sediminis TaxID=2798584 RepID=A0A8J7M0S2_9BACT|nr:tetratricopeptide repeat protein [Geomesophilobacter sediminis]MBJ6726492.1 tetratricopeptide repeat protein [Geomesophilobacter sediminis]
MNCTDALTALNIIVATLGLMFIGITIYEYVRLKTIRNDFENLSKRLREENIAAQKAMHRIIASYSLSDPLGKIELLESAEKIDPTAFNLYNSIGYAWLSKGEQVRAANAFREATRLHPNDKAGYFDLAYVYVLMNQPDLALECLERAVQVDPSSAADLKDNPQFAAISAETRYQRLTARP